MQAINRIQNAMINANANIQGAMVVTVASAHRDYHSFVPCDPKPVSKCPGKRPSSSCTTTTTLSRGRLGLMRGGRGVLASGPVGRGWRMKSQPEQMPATLWATFVLNRNLCG